MAAVIGVIAVRVVVVRDVTLAVVIVRVRLVMIIIREVLVWAIIMIRVTRARAKRIEGRQKQVSNIYNIYICVIYI